MKFLMPVLFTVIGASTGCTDAGTSSSDYANTHAKLRNIAEILERLDARQNLKGNKSIEDAFVDWSKLGIIKEHAQHLKFDGWDKLFEWNVKEDGKDVVVLINSKGPDGISQDGMGDDIYLEFHISKDGATKYEIHRPRK